MKRPEGFDKGEPAAPAPKRQSVKQPTTKQPTTKQPTAKATKPAPAQTNTATAAAKQAERPAPAKRQRGVGQPSRSAATTRAATARREARAAARERKRFERGEVRRFTRHVRTRRVTILIIGAIVAALIGVLAIAVYSPLLALRTIAVDGVSRLSADQVIEAVDGQLGTPLALVDFDRMTEELSEFTVIRSYVTETVPPDTIIIHIVERQPVAVVVNGGSFDVIDPAGIVLATVTERPADLPLVVLGETDFESPAFASIVEVLLALPEGLRLQVDAISAVTTDDVTFSLRGVGQSVVWGSADDSAYKARTLAAMIPRQDPAALLEYDVSAPGSVVVVPR